jgi:nucleoside 2-deoxyribosyltransferase
MSTCFVIQPFDAGKFDKRFTDVFSPAIEAAGLKPYRVDQDPSAEVLIDAIEEGIRRATICLADITTDNPNIWYELGYAHASNVRVVMVCSEERTGRKYPFDIQHRNIIQYKTESSQDFEKLKQQITARIESLLNSADAMRQIASNEQVAPVHGLSQTELIVLASIAGLRTEADGGAAVHLAKHDVERSGFTPVAFSLGLRRLQKKGFVSIYKIEDRDGLYEMVQITNSGWDWVEENEDKFTLRKVVVDPPF